MVLSIDNITYTVLQLFGQTYSYGFFSNVKKLWCCSKIYLKMLRYIQYNGTNIYIYVPTVARGHPYITRP